MNIIKHYKRWLAGRSVRRQKVLCERGYHNWTDKPENRIQCVDPGCGRYLR